MGRRNNFLSTNELIKIHKNSKTYDFEASLELFIEDCKLRNLRSHSISYYLSELKVFERYLLEQEISTAPDSITQEVIRRITEMTEEMSRSYRGIDSHYEVLIKDKSFELINFLLVGNYGSLIIKAKNLKTAMKVFESVKLLFAFCDHIYDEDMALFRMENNLESGKDLKIYDLNHNRNSHVRDYLEDGAIIGTLRFKKLEELLKLIVRDSRLRTALACFYQAQETYYTHLVSSYITMHSRLDLHYYETDEYSFLNAINYEKFCSSLTTAYRGIEAIMDYNFRERIFENDHYKKVIDNRIDGVKWNTKYLKAFDKVRYGDVSKKSYVKVSTMIKKFLFARDRAGHGKIYADQKKNNPITMELTHESKRFLEFLSIEYIDSRIDITEL